MSACADLDGTNASGLWPLAAPKPARVPLGDRPMYPSGEGSSSHNHRARLKRQYSSEQALTIVASASG
jgi:hypothetical protein